MPFMPATTTDDSFYYIIRISKYYYNKRIKKILNIFALINFCYAFLLFYNLLYNFKNVQEEDVFAGAIFLEVLVSKVSLDSLQHKLVEFSEDTLQRFWSNKNLLVDLNGEKKFFGLMLILIAVTIVVTLVLLAALSLTLPTFVYNKNWNLWVKVIYRTFGLIYVSSNFYITFSTVCYSLYLALHYRFQTKILENYIRREMKNYKHMRSIHKFYSDLYQEEVRQILLRTIKHHQVVKTYAQKVTAAFNETGLLHFVLAVAFISVGVHSVVFNTTKYAPILMVVIINAILVALLFTELGQLIIKTGDEFYITLTQLEWYTFKKYNRRLYYMFICYAQRYSVVTLISDTTADRALLMQFLRTIYSAIAVLKSVKT